MPKSSKRSKSSSSKDRKKDKTKSVKPEEPDETPVEAPPVVETPVTPKNDKKKDKDNDKKKDKKEKPVEETVTETVTETTDEQTPGKRQRRVVTKESVLDDFDQFLQDVEAEITAQRDVSSTKKTKATGVRFARMVAKRVKALRSDASRVMRTRKQSTRPKNTSSGFMKPVKISSEMAQFTGWEPDVPRSRVDVTKYICQYIRDNDLQNPADRRIIRPDSQLKSLLNLQEQDNDKNPLTYYSLQKSIQHHFTNEAKPVPA